jgi:hypothetical protein
MEPVLKKVIVDGIRQNRSDTSDCTKGVGSGAKMGNAPQVFKRVPFLGDRIGFWVIDPTMNRNGRSLNLNRLTPAF